MSVLQPSRSGVRSKVMSGGLVGGLVGAATIWVYEAVVWVGVEHLMPLEGIPRNAVGLALGRPVQQDLGPWSYPLGTAIHFAFAAAWGVAFAVTWHRLRFREWESAMLALPFAALVWIIMHPAIAVVTRSHPDYADPNVVIGGFVLHLFYAVPLAMVVKGRLPAPTTEPGGGPAAGFQSRDMRPLVRFARVVIPERILGGCHDDRPAMRRNHRFLGDPTAEVLCIRGGGASATPTPG